jgi:5-formyltetrahydrofolate cyclo-ligase
VSEPAHRLKQRKRAVRRAAIERRDALDPAERARASRAIAGRVLGLPELRGARTVMAFWSFGSEVDTAPLLEALEAAGIAVVLPRIEGGDVVAVPYAPGDPVATTAFGAMEPTGPGVLEPAEVDAVIVPGVAFDRRGGRVGYGGGFYDRYLPRTRPGTPAIGVAFAEQLVEEVPSGSFDRPVDVVVTQEGVLRRDAAHEAT